MDSPTLDSLPPDLLAEVAKCLPPRSICRLAAVCRATAAAVTGPPSVWELLLPPQLRAAAAAAAEAAGETAAPTGVAAVAAAASPTGLPIGCNADGAACAVVVLPTGGGTPPHAATPCCAWPPPAVPRAPATPAWRVALPASAAAVSWAHASEYWKVLPGGGPSGRDALALRRVWWFDVTATVEAALPGGDYEVALEMVGPPNAAHGWPGGMAGVEVVVLPLPPPMPATRSAGWGGAAPPPLRPPPPPSASRAGARARPPPRRQQRESTGSRGRLEALAAPAVSAAAPAMRGDGGDGSRDIGDSGVDGSGCEQAVARPAVLAVKAAAPRPWMRIVLAQRLPVVAGGGVRVQLVCHNVATRKADVVFGDVWLTPLGRGEE